MKMRDLEAKTGVNRETIRVYFRKGLLPEPERPARNVADYGEEHVSAIASVRKLQRQSGMTLEQIKSLLDGNAGDNHLGASAFPHLERLVALRVGVESRLVPLSSMLDDNPHAHSDAEALSRIGAIELIDSEENGTCVSITDAGLITIWSRMRVAGFDEKNGFPPDILGYYLEAAEIVAGNEARMFLERVEGRIDEERAATMLEFALPTMLDFFGLIRLKTFLRHIRVRTREDGAPAN